MFFRAKFLLLAFALMAIGAFEAHSIAMAGPLSCSREEIYDQGQDNHHVNDQRNLHAQKDFHCLTGCTILAAADNVCLSNWYAVPRLKPTASSVYEGWEPPALLRPPIALVQLRTTQPQFDQRSKDMKKFVFLSTLSLLLSSAAFAQDSSSHSDHGASGEQVTLPAACEEVARQQGGQMDMSQMISGMQQMMDNMDDVQKANMQAMMKMEGPMMRAMTIKDPDLAFNCGMIAHHQGAIAMAQVELKMGKDEKSRKMAQMIIDAQKKEITEMTAWVEKHSNQ